MLQHTVSTQHRQRNASAHCKHTAPQTTPVCYSSSGKDSRWPSLAGLHGEEREDGVQHVVVVKVADVPLSLLHCRQVRPVLVHEVFTPEMQSSRHVVPLTMCRRANSTSTCTGIIAYKGKKFAEFPADFCGKSEL